jgi:hypothetical protein
MNRLLLSGLLASLLLFGCARFPSGSVSNPAARQLVVTVEFAAPLDSRYYYFVALDTNQDSSDGPVPVVQGPYWGNGWGTGPISEFVEYHNGQFSVNRPFVLLTLTATQGSVTDISGSPDRPLAGTHTLTVGEITLGATTLSGGGNILGVTNVSDQNAGTITITSDDTGTIEPNGVNFEKADPGGRDLTPAEQAALDALNAGGVTLAAGSLAPLGLSLTVRPSSFLAGTQTIRIDPTQGTVRDVFVPAGGFAQSESWWQVTANATSDPVLSPIPGVSLVVGNLTSGQTATVVAQMQQTATYIGPPYAQEPVTGNTLTFTLDLDTLGPASVVKNLEVNIIATDKLIIVPDSTETKTWDALGPPESPEFVSISTTATTTYSNDQALVPEQAGDCAIPSLDIVDWSLEIRLL